VTLRATIAGPPVPFARPRFDGRSGRAFQAPGYARWRSTAALVLRAGLVERVEAGPVEVWIEAHHPRPAARPAWMDREAWARGDACLAVTRMDADNIAKAVLDALATAGAFADDRQVAMLELSSWYAPRGRDPAIQVRVARARA